VAYLSSKWQFTPNHKAGYWRRFIARALSGHAVGDGNLCAITAIFCFGYWDDFQWVTEFGQWVHFYTGFAVSDVEYALQRDETRIAFLHLGADFLMRDAYTTPRGLQFCLLDSTGHAKTSERQKHDLAGPLCFAGDYIGRAVELPRAQEGDQLLIMNTGSNAFGLWSRHCSRTIPKVLGVSQRDDEVKVLSERCNLYS
jgi:diaminopimelate decarboxylase